ncbi:polysaccharide deacetylase family protein [Actinacidiphila soli]|uniref:hypothetical protein n=1 Tax=Actinacidiphila soli TaxID=2487275 RepID=UPI000FCB670A|nr:hypothetical protein [Actinacidiphila soli]
MGSDGDSGGTASAAANASGGDSGGTASAAANASGGASAQAKKNSGSGKKTTAGGTRIIGDGSTSDTGAQPGRLKPTKLKPGEKPPQFVVFSWDGALEGDDHLFSHFRELAKQNNAHMTFFLTGMYLVPKSKRKLYHPPLHPVGTAAISFATDQHIKDTLTQLTAAWEDGNEIGTHFNGHFCGDPGQGGGGDWTVAQWKSEIKQAYSFVENWKTNTGWTGIDPLPFDYQKELVGGRAPCLEGQTNLLKAAKTFGWRYDASSPGDFQIWPAKKNGIWDFPLQLLPYPNNDFQVLSMDYNLLANQSGGSTDGDSSQYTKWGKESRDAYLNGFERVYNGSRAPLFIGNHFEEWNGGIYMKAVEDVMKSVCKRKGVQCVSFKELADWMNAQDPAVLQKLRLLDPAQSPDWKTYLKK